MASQHPRAGAAQDPDDGPGADPADSPADGPDTRVRLGPEAADEVADALADRPDLGRARARVLADRDEATAVLLAHRGRPHPDDDPASRPAVTVALLDAGADRPDWARFRAAHPDPRVR